MKIILDKEIRGKPADPVLRQQKLLPVMMSRPFSFYSIRPKMFMQPEKKVVMVRTKAKPIDTTD